jgi:hypothetical protein
MGQKKAENLAFFKREKRAWVYFVQYCSDLITKMLKIL